MYKRPPKKRDTKNILKWVYISFFCLISIWLIVSIVLQKNPTDVLSNAFSKIPTPSDSHNNLLIIQKDSLISSLEKQLSDCRSNGSFAKAIVIIEGSSLNMRSEASLTSDVVLKIPASSEVEIMFYDTETYYLNGQAGQWCRIRYAGTQGWVWGNFLREI
jgi:hypothetical protein